MKKVYLDTNIILRLLMKENSALCEQAQNKVLKYTKEGYLIETTDLVIAELFYVMESKVTTPTRSRTEIAELIYNFVVAINLDFPTRNIFKEVLTMYKTTNIDYVDIHLFLMAKTNEVEYASLASDFKKMERIYLEY